MTTDHEPRRTEEPVREREVIVTDGRRSSGVGTVIAAVLGILAVLLVGYLLFNAFGGEGGGTDELNLDAPEEVDVNLNEGGAEG